MMNGRLFFLHGIAGLLALILGPLALTSSAAAEPWYYTIDEARNDQQANFCRTETDVRELASIFVRFGPRTGYSALAEARACWTAIKTFTPRRIITHVVISEGKPGEYILRFVEVQIQGGETVYLVTTRDVRP